MDSVRLRTETGEQWQERERLLREWTQCGRRVAKLFDEHPATMNSSKSNSAGFEEQIRRAMAAETEACLAYYQHANSHNGV